MLYFPQLGIISFFLSLSLSLSLCKYSIAHRQQCTVANFIIGQAKLAIWKSCRLAAEGRNINLLQLFTALVESRIRVEHRFFQMTNNLLEFEFKWCANRGMGKDGEIMFNC